MTPDRRSASRSDRLLIFVFVGPLVGWAMFFLPLVPAAVLSGGLRFPGANPLEVVGFALLFLGITVSAAYVIGFLPAWLTGLASEKLMNLPGPLRVGVSVAIGAALSALVVAVVGNTESAIAIPAVVGAVAALVCNLLVLRSERRQRKSPAPESGADPQ